MFRKSSFSGGGGCVEVTMKYGFIFVRDSKDRKSELAFTPQEWEAFVLGVKDDEFDLDVLKLQDTDQEQNQKNNQDDKEDTHGRS